jgi:hypothetical protein
MLKTRVGAIVYAQENYRISEIFEVLPGAAERLMGYSPFGELASPMIIYANLVEAREALDDLLRARLG